MSNQLDRVLDALGEPNRRRIVELLADRPRPVGGVAAELPIGRPAVSKHLKVLGDAGLVRHHSRGTSNVYALAPDGLVELRRWLEGTWGEVLGSFAAYVDTAEAPRPEQEEE